MRLTTGAIHSLFIVFSQGLDSCEEVVPDAQGKPRVTQKMFSLGALRLTIAVNANKLKPIVQSFEEARNALLMELSGGKGEINQTADPAAFAKYQDALQSMTSAEHEIDLKALSKAALKLDLNPITIQALMILEENGLLVD